MFHTQPLHEIHASVTVFVPPVLQELLMFRGQFMALVLPIRNLATKALLYLH
jgi:hypothetical protein